MVELCNQFYKRVREILALEGIKPDKQTQEAIVQLIIRYSPDWRRVLNELQRASMSGQLELSLLNSPTGYDQLFDHLKAKDFKKMRTWVANNMDVDVSSIFRHIYDEMYERVDSSSIPQLVLILADYQYKNAFVADHELNVVACMTEIMANVEFT